MGKYLDWKMIFSIQLCLFLLMENFCSDETFFFFNEKSLMEMEISCLLFIFFPFFLENLGFFYWKKKLQSRRENNISHKSVPSLHI